MQVTQRAINTYTMHYAEVNARKAQSPKFHVGDKVRITKGTFEKRFTPDWTEEVFTISSVKATKPPAYTIKDMLGEPVQGDLIELQLTEQEILCIKQVLKKKKNQVCVKSKGYSDTFNLSIPLADLEDESISKQYASRPAKTAIQTIHSFLQIYEDWLLEGVDVGKLQEFLNSCFSLVG